MINLTTGGSPHMTVAERLKPAHHFQPEVASLNMGSMNFGLYPMLDRFKELKHDWERQHLANSRDLVFKNTFADVEYILTLVRRERHALRVRVLRHLAPVQPRAFRRSRPRQAPFFVQSVFGLLGGIGAHPEDLAHMNRTADRLFGSDYVWSILGAGRNQIPLATMGVAQGSNARVGLEDSLWIGPGKLAESSAAQVKKIRAGDRGAVAGNRDAGRSARRCSTQRAQANTNF